MSFKKSFVSSALASSMALTGCGTGPAEAPASDDSRAPIAAQPESVATLGTEVTGTRLLHYRTDTGDFVQPVDTFASPMSAFVVENGVKRPLTVQQAVDGSFRIPDAPVGEYFLQLGTYYIATDSRSVNLNRYELGRRNVALASSSQVPVKLTVSHLAPVTGWTSFQATSSNINSIADLAGELPPGENLTALTDWPMQLSEYSGSTGARIVNGTRGDWLSIHQLTQREGDGFSYNAVERAFVPAPFTLSTNAAAPSVLSGRFELAPQQTVEFTWARSRFEAWRASTHPLAGSTVTGGQSFTLYPTAWGDDAFYGYTGELVSAYLSGTGRTDLTPRVTFGNPYLSWGTAGQVSHSYALPLRLPGTTAGNLSVSLTDMRPLKSFTAGPVAPRVSPPQEPTVDGLSAWQERTLSSLTPRLTWKAPRIGTPSAYRVRVSRLYTLSTSPTITRYSTVAQFITGRTELTVPPNVLQPGERYVFSVIAYATPGVDYARQPFALEALIDAATATSVSSVLTAPGTMLKAVRGEDAAARESFEEASMEQDGLSRWPESKAEVL
jgi:hypothetical protein